MDTMNPFAVRTLIKIQLIKEKTTFEADARVMFSHAGMGMGVAFVSAMPDQLQVLHNWLTELAGKTSSEQEPEKETQPVGVAANSAENQDSVLGDLIKALTKRRVLNEVEGKAMLHRLHR